MAGNKIELIRQALAASESSIKLAKQMLSELERAGGRESLSRPKEKKDTAPGILGVFDGEQMVTDQGEKYPVPENYASKSILVVGDTLKLVEEGKEKRFKQIEHVKRHKTMGILAKKDGKWKAVTSEGSYKVLPASVAHYNGDVGDEVVLHLPASNLSVSYGAIESVKSKTAANEESPIVESEIKGKEETQIKQEVPTQQAKSSGSKKKKQRENKPLPIEEPKTRVEEIIAETVTAKEAPKSITQTIDEDELT